MDSVHSVEIQAEDGLWHSMNEEDEDGWTEDDEENGDNRSLMSLDDVGPPPRLIPIEDAPSEGKASHEATASSNREPESEAKGNIDPTDADESEESEDGPWKRFDVLATAPADHAFYSTVPSQPSRSFLSRLTKEYRALSSSLPGGFPSSLRLG